MTIFVPDKIDNARNRAGITLVVWSDWLMRALSISAEKAINIPMWSTASSWDTGTSDSMASSILFPISWLSCWDGSWRIGRRIDFLQCMRIPQRQEKCTLLVRIIVLLPKGKRKNYEKQKKNLCLVSFLRNKCVCLQPKCKVLPSKLFVR